MVSVIVPIYNVENYVKKCLDSLAVQTLEDVEFILIDDGSTDSSGKIADQYSSDPRFHIFHTENRGLSAARNYGIDQSHGEYLMFVDGDDWVSPQFCELPYKAAQENKADLVIFSSCEDKGKKPQNSQISEAIEQAKIIDCFTAFQVGELAAWNKLYAKGLFRNIRYPIGRVYEDIATTHKLIYSATQIFYLPIILYYHVFRNNSISHLSLTKIRRDGFLSASERYADLISYGYLAEKHINTLYETAIGYLVSTNAYNDDLYLQAINVVNSIKGIPKLLSRKKRVALLIWKTNKTLFNCICRLTVRKKSKMLL